MTDDKGTTGFGSPKPAASASVAERREPKNVLYCSFCGKSQHEVSKLIAGPTVFICDECVELCRDILKEEGYQYRVPVFLRTDEVFSRREIQEAFKKEPLTGRTLLEKAVGVSLPDTELVGVSAAELFRSLEEAIFVHVAAVTLDEKSVERQISRVSDDLALLMLKKDEARDLDRTINDKRRLLTLLRERAVEIAAKDIAASS